MLKDITLGQYFPGNSFIHKLDPRTKLIVLVVYIVALFLAVNWASYALMAAFLLLCIKISTIPAKSFIRGMKPLMMILIFTGVLNLFFTTEGELLVEAKAATLEILNPVGEVLAVMEGEPCGDGVCFRLDGAVPGVQYRLIIK